VDKQLEAVNRKVQMLQKEKERFTIQLKAKRKASEKLEKLIHAKKELKKCKRK
jgi:hypothetical protein